MHEAHGKTVQSALRLVEMKGDMEGDSETREKNGSPSLTHIATCA
jgi:hypothetical protein